MSPPKKEKKEEKKGITDFTFHLFDIYPIIIFVKKYYLKASFDQSYSTNRMEMRPSKMLLFQENIG